MHDRRRPVRANRLLVVAAASLLLAMVGCRRTTAPVVAAGAPQRIVSMAPSITETLFALGLGPRVVGVTRYCRYPPEARQLPKIGGHLDPSYEAIVALEPDLVILHRAQQEAERRLQDLGFATLRVDQDRLAGILDSIGEIAAACGVAPRGRELRARIEAQLQRASVPPSPADPRVLIVANRTVGSGRITTLWASGRDTYHDELLRLAGGVNALGATPVAYPELSREGLLTLDPDVILDLAPDLSQRGVSAAAAVADWRDLGQLRAVRDHRVHVLDSEVLVVPGPRVAEAVAMLAAVLHPERVPADPGTNP